MYLIAIGKKRRVAFSSKSLWESGQCLDWIKKLIGELTNKNHFSQRIVTVTNETGIYAYNIIVDQIELIFWCRTRTLMEKIDSGRPSNVD